MRRIGVTYLSVGLDVGLECYHFQVTSVSGRLSLASTRDQSSHTLLSNTFNCQLSWDTAHYLALVEAQSRPDPRRLQHLLAPDM